MKDMILELKDVSKSDVALVGGKGANLGEMLKHGVSVPNGFVITTQAFKHFLIYNSLDLKIEALADELKANAAETSATIRKMIESATMSASLRGKIIDAYDRLAVEEAMVAVRSSSPHEDMAGASFAGQYDTYLNTKGKSQLIDNVKRCFASLFSERSIEYKKSKGFSLSDAKIAVVVQQMVQSKKSGVMFTRGQAADKGIIVEAVEGLGEELVSGRATPAYYVLDEQGSVVKSLRQGVLSNQELQQLAAQAKALEQVFGCPQDVEFAIDDKLHIVQSRPLTGAA